MPFQQVPGQAGYDHRIIVNPPVVEQNDPYQPIVTYNYNLPTQVHQMAIPKPSFTGKKNPLTFLEELEMYVDHFGPDQQRMLMAARSCFTSGIAKK
jgi:hypothetical protein